MSGLPEYYDHEGMPPMPQLPAPTPPAPPAPVRYADLILWDHKNWCPSCKQVGPPVYLPDTLAGPVHCACLNARKAWLPPEDQVDCLARWGYALGSPSARRELQANLALVEERHRLRARLAWIRTELGE